MQKYAKACNNVKKYAYVFKHIQKKVNKKGERIIK